MTTEQAKAIAKLSKATLNGEVGITLLPPPYEEVLGIHHWPKVGDGAINALMDEYGNLVWANL